MNYTKNNSQCQWHRSDSGSTRLPSVPNYKDKLINAWGEFLNQFTWDWYVTLTFAEPVGLWSANRKLWSFIRAIRKSIKHRVEFFAVTESQKFRNVPHYHLLMLNCSEVYRYHWWEWWFEKFGRARIEPYDEKLGARFYLGKYLNKDSDYEIFLSRGLRKVSSRILPRDSQGISLMSPLLITKG